MTSPTLTPPSDNHPQPIPLGFNLIYKAALGATCLALGLANIAVAQRQDPQPENTRPERLTQERLQIEPQSSPSYRDAFAQTAGRAIAPPALPTPAPEPFSPVLSGITDLFESTETLNSVGHLRPTNLAALADDNVDWLKSTILPLYLSPGGEPWGWIYQGWFIPGGQSRLAIGRDAGFSMIRPYENLYTFPVLERREDGWFRVQYTAGGSAWAHTSQLTLGETALMVESWENHLKAQGAVHFLDSAKAQPLRSQPQSARNMLSLVPADSLIEPTVFQGDWMLVRVTRPTMNCTPLTGATVTEGWMRWRTENGTALTEYRPNSDCSQ